MSFEMEEIQVIELKMMDKRKYFPLTLASGLTIRSMLYPFMLIKTRLQIQRSKTIYNGTFDALIKIGRNEGSSGLYRGFWVSCLQLFPSMAYISSYEGIRHYMSEHMGVTDNSARAFFAGGAASIVGQTLAVPLDIVTQHLMLMGRREKTKDSKLSPVKKSTSPEAKAEKVKAKQKLTKLQHFHISEEEARTRLGSVKAIVKAIYKQDGALGFYKGYFVSLACFAPNSALWWFFYDSYSNILYSMSPDGIPRLGIQVVAAPLSGVSSALLTNPMDVIRARLQVEGLKLRETVEILWREEGMWMATKGLSARLVQSITFSFFLMLGYETIKRWSILDEYKDRIRW
ncbi:solute carrier family 25 member 44 [Plakobranchus ocellatus]|uniref:Solute carrier family 25 member 44 n=1 Tax=Plakobranchus ocellatus TaxID=259542 RepID=A0AAV3YFV7_9GAST|nr:solute carrier family 25 member 44 [Plakobranchus ocellatus]